MQCILQCIQLSLQSLRLYTKPEGILCLLFSSSLTFLWHCESPDPHFQLLPTLASGIMLWSDSHHTYRINRTAYHTVRVLLLESLRGQYLVNSCSLCILLNHWLSDQVFTSLFNFPTESFRPYQTAFLTSIHGWRTIIWNSTLAKLNWYTNLRKILPCWRCQSALMPSQSSQHTQLKISWFDFRWWTQVSQYHHINHHILQISSSSTINLLASHHTEYLFYRAFKMPHDWLFLVTRI